VRVAYYSLQGQYEETVRSVTSAVPLFGCSLTLMVGYIMFSLGKWGDKARYSKIHVGLVGTFNVVLSTVIAFGMCCAMGIMLTPISQIVPFLLLGIGIDDMFVIVRALELVPESAGSVPTRMKIAMRDCGGSITVTSVTDAIAFCVGATIRFPAMRAFCLHCAVGIVVSGRRRLSSVARPVLTGGQAYVRRVLLSRE
jgi:Niemann-Pick C1 protein